MRIVFNPFMGKFDFSDVGDLSVHASTTSAQLAGVISDETGSGALVFATSPTLVTPLLGVASATSLACPTFTTASGAMGFTPAAGSNFNITLSTTGDFAVNTNQLYVDTSTGNVGIGTTSPTQRLDIDGKFVVKSTGEVGIGTTNPSYQFEVKGSNAGIYLDRTGSEGFILVSQNNLSGGGQLRSVSGGGLRITNAGASTEWVRINSSGNVGIGTTNPDQLLTLVKTIPATGTTYGVSSTISGTGHGSGNSAAGYFSANQTLSNPDVGGNVYGVYGIANSNASTPRIYGGYFTSAASGSRTSYGIYAEGKRYGVYGLSTGGAPDYPGYGGYFSATASNNADVYGGYFSATNAYGNANTYGLYTTASGATNNFALYSAAGTNYMSGNVGIGTTAPTSILALGGNSARVFQMERGTVANTAGYNLSVIAGGATSGATDKNGGNLLLQGGLSTGTGESGVAIYGCVAGATGTTDRTQTIAIQTLGNKIGFFAGTPIVKQSFIAYTADNESGAYTGINNAQAGTPYAQLTDLNALRVAYENIRVAYEDLKAKMVATTLVTTA